jgi:phosphoribosylformylglycinamidine (FGAM) synthase-like enzyme
VNVEGARMYQACSAIKDALLQLGVAIDGGKDSLTMAAKVSALKTSTRLCCNKTDDFLAHQGGQ